MDKAEGGISSYDERSSSISLLLKSHNVGLEHSQEAQL